MAIVRDHEPKLHPQIKREIAEACWTEQMRAIEAVQGQTLPAGAASWFAENYPDTALRERFGGLLGGESYWDRLEAHLARAYAGKTTIVASDTRKAPRLPVPHVLVPWGKLGQKDYPDPRFCSEIQGLLEFGIYWPLWKLGIPLDFKYPLSDTEKRTSEAATYRRQRIKPLLDRARQLAVSLEQTAEGLLEAERENPSYRSVYSDKPFMESPNLRWFKGAKNLARLAKEWIDRAGYVKKGRPPESTKNDLAKRLAELGLDDKSLAEAFKLLGLEGAGDAKDRVRQRRRRQK